MKQQWGGLAAAAVVLAGLAGGAGPGAAQEKTLTIWSHFADHEGVRSFFREVEALFESENPASTWR
jgi:ABC-type glycerol-3-phosphate transport system substrate-binding protein